MELLTTNTGKSFLLQQTKVRKRLSGSSLVFYLPAMVLSQTLSWLQWKNVLRSFWH